MSNRREFLKLAVLLAVAVCFSVHTLFAQDAAPPKRDVHLFAVSYTDIIHPQKVPARKITIPDVDGYKVLKGDFHIHTICSDGLSMPQDRVHEAVDNGLDVIAITDHTNCEPYAAYRDMLKMLSIKNRDGFDGEMIDRNLPYLLAKPEADRQKLLLIPGTEISY